MELKKINISDVEVNNGQIEGLPANPRQWTKGEFDKLRKSLKETPELFEARGVIVYPLNGKYIALGGNMRLEAARANKAKEVPCIVLPASLTIEKLKEIVIKDNGSFGAWDIDSLANEWDDLPLEDWGTTMNWGEDNHSNQTESEEEAIEAKRREFEERMANGENLEEDEEYLAFLEKFQQAKTTDDCYTPPIIYEAILEYVKETYGVKESQVIRPFYPGGDYENETYPQGCVVVDNPPFSILAEILNFYHDNKIKFFLFAPNLTLSASYASRMSTALATGAQITYDNGANVNTSFLTNLGDESIRVKSAPKLYQIIKEANERNLAESKVKFPKYTYPPYIITSPFVAQLSRVGIEFVVPVAESEYISALEHQKEFKKAIYGAGYIVSERIKQIREKAEEEKEIRDKAEREKAIKWELSKKEIEIIKRLSGDKRD